ncbi:Signal transduction histidine kinase [Nocardiopsis flavescens]|uniref:histidine kinase n=2 Tax=Nocardiopsis flavescens TaxID=758803 RepID=A0A1M6KBB1_9ACTN|nr:Signal transduction histidine kinase [Nocardiopsis flavescens]
MQAVPPKRGRTIASRIRAMVTIPTAALLALWLILTLVLAYDAGLKLIRASATDEMVTPAAVGLVDAMRERARTMAFIEHPDDPGLAADLAGAREATDASLGAVIGDLIGFVDFAPGESGHHITMLHEEYGRIDEIRAAVDEGSIPRGEALEYYNELVLHGADTFDGHARTGVEAAAVDPGFSAVYMFRAVDLFARADAQLAQAFSNDELTWEDQLAFAELVGSYRHLLEANGPYLSGPGQQERYEAVLAGPEFERLTEMEARIVERRITTETVTDPVTLAVTDVEDLSMPVNGDDWAADHAYVLGEFTAIGADEAQYAAEITRDQANRAVLVAVGGSLGVAAVFTVAFLLARRSSRSLTGRLVRLRDDANDLAEKRLPELMDRLHRGERVDTEAMLPLMAASDDEIGDVAGAFNTAQRAAVDEAVQQAELRQGINRVFLNIAHRSQTLVHRQLRLLDKMEREQEDPEQLAQLFKLDHLATRSRRNAENLLILGGEAPGRTWHRPMPLIDVLRGAISESGDYTRVKRERIARVHLNGPAVADVIHLVAELVDNASMFSPPHTQVRLSSEDVPNGVTIEIEDRGLGMSEEELRSANTLLADPPEFDVMRLNEKMRLGLFVVSHLAHRHGIKVHLRTSPYGGVQAIVLLPHEIITGERTSLPAAQEQDGDIWEVREIIDYAPGGALESGAAPAPVPGEDGPPPAPAPGGPAEAGASPPADGTAPAHVHGADVLDDARPPLPTRRPAADAAPGAADAGPERVEAGGGRPSLPKRRPQQNLAPQLAADPVPAPGDGASGGAPAPGAGGAERLARLRRNMTAFQQGTDRGRREGRQQTHETDKDE